MKHCKRCDLVKDLTEFNKNSSRVDGLQANCRSCQKAIDAGSYLRSQQRRDEIKARRVKIREHNKKLVRRYKSLCGCRICGLKEPVILDLHHLDPAEKDADPSSMVNYATARLKAEIRKCVVLCSNHHRMVHAGLTILPE